MKFNFPPPSLIELSAGLAGARYVLCPVPAASCDSRSGRIWARVDATRAAKVARSAAFAGLDGAIKNYGKMLNKKKKTIFSNYYLSLATLKSFPTKSQISNK